MGLLKNIFTLGGAYRLEKARARYDECLNTYEHLVASLTSCNALIESTVSTLKKSFLLTKTNLLLANKILAPKCLHGSGRHTLDDFSANGRSLSVTQRTDLALRNASSNEIILGGAAIGTSTALIAWQGAQILGIASTGTAMIGLHGAAASNAGWALFGGGSLATGGGGMALGHLLLPGIGIAVAVGFSAITTHSKANELNTECCVIDEANNRNKATLAKVDANLVRLLKSKQIYDVADSELSIAVRVAKRRLRPLGFLSVFFRYLRFKVKGIYYTASEEVWVAELDEAVREFMGVVGVTAP